MVLDETGRLYFINNLSETGDIKSNHHSSKGRFLLSSYITQYYNETISLTTSTANTIKKYMAEALFLVTSYISSPVKLLIETVTLTHYAIKSTLTRYITQSVNVADHCYNSIKRYFDIETYTIAASATFFKATIKNFTESVSVACAMGNRTIIIIQNSILNVSDTVNKSLTRKMDTLSLLITDYLPKTLNRPLYETISIANSIIKTITRTIVQSVYINTIFSTTINIYVYLTESIGISCSVSKRFFKELMENITATCVYGRYIYKYIVENISIVFLKGKVTLTRNILQPTSIVGTVYKSTKRYLSESMIITTSLNWLRPVIHTAKTTAAIVVKRATKLFLGGERL